MYLRRNYVRNESHDQKAGIILLQDLCFGRLWVSKVHHLIQQLVDDDKVIPYALLLKLLEILCKDLDNLVQEQENLGGICVAFCEGEKVEVVVADVEVVDTFAGKAWWDGRALVFGLAE